MAGVCEDLSISLPLPPCIIPYHYFQPDGDNSRETSTFQSDQPLNHEQHSADILQPPEKPTTNPPATSSTSVPQESPEVVDSDAVSVVYKLVTLCVGHIADLFLWHGIHLSEIAIYTLTAVNT